MKPFRTGSLVLLAIAFGVPSAIAQRETLPDEDPLFSAPLLEFNGQSIQEFFNSVWIPRSRFTNSPHLREGFRSIVRDVRKATVEVRKRGRRIAFGGIVGPNGWIITKASLVRGPVTCRLKDGREYDARLVGIDSDYDLAMLKVEAKDLPTLELGGPELVESDAFVAMRATEAFEAAEAFDASDPIQEPSMTVALQPGDWLATVGIVRDPIAIGVVSVLPRRIEKRDGFLGIAMDRNYLGGQGDPPSVRISKVYANTAASEAGLKEGDLIVEADSTKTPTSDDLKRVISKHNPGDRVEIKVRRAAEVLTLAVVLRGSDSIPQGISPAEFRAYKQNRLGGELSERRFGFPAALQHDTFLEPDECGGPIVDLDGRVVGFNISRAGRTESYALPVESVRGRLFELMSGRLAPVTVG
ncbi:MAG: PDZ domain-containing protein, partial [Planctomycetota bacterium]